MKTVKKRSQKQERKVAKTFNAKVTPASGALWGAKGDVRNEKFLIECKTTEKDNYRVTVNVWEKIRNEAVKDHMRIPLLVVSLKDSETYVIFNPHSFEKSLDALEVIHSESETKSFRLLSNMLSLIEDTPLSFNLTATIGLPHKLVVWAEKQFLEYYEEELKCGEK